MNLKVNVPEVLEAFPLCLSSSANCSWHTDFLFSQAVAGRREWALIVLVGGGPEMRPIRLRG